MTSSDPTLRRVANAIPRTASLASRFRLPAADLEEIGNLHAEAREHIPTIEQRIRPKLARAAIRLVDRQCALRWPQHPYLPRTRGEVILHAAVHRGCPVRW